VHFLDVGDACVQICRHLLKVPPLGAQVEAVSADAADAAYDRQTPGDVSCRLEINISTMAEG
jgi:hypothetical protein